LWPEAELSNRAGICSGSASAAKEPGQTILVPGHRDFFFSGRPQNTKAANAAEIVSLSNKTKRSDMVKFLFSVHTITKAKQYAGREPGRWICQRGHLTWCALV